MREPFSGGWPRRDKTASRAAALVKAHLGQRQRHTKQLLAGLAPLLHSIDNQRLLALANRQVVAIFYGWGERVHRRQYNQPPLRYNGSMKVDLHCHTRHSDGELDAPALLALAAEREIALLAITDHDSLGAHDELAASGEPDNGVKLLPGIELSTSWRGRGVHIVGLNIDPANKQLRAGIAQQQAARERRAEIIDQRLAKLGFANTLVGARQRAANGFIGRPHFAAELVARGVVKDHNAAFKKYLGAGKAGDIKEQWADLATVVEWITAAGGTAVLAHPDKYQLTRTKLCELLDDFTGVGGTAMEVVSGNQTHAASTKLAQLCRQFNLLASSGSDYHGPSLPWASLGNQPALPGGLNAVWEQF